MEIEVKLRLSKSSFDRLKPLLHKESEHKGIRSQTNYFFDNPSKTLTSTRTVFRIRKSLNQPPNPTQASVDTITYTSTVKGKALLVDGICRVEESEDVIPNAIAEAIITQKSLIDSYRMYFIVNMILFLGIQP